jgi:hypothetical protein
MMLVTVTLPFGSGTDKQTQEAAYAAITSIQGYRFNLAACHWHWFTNPHSQPPIHGAFCPSKRGLGYGLQRLVCEPEAD